MGRNPRRDGVRLHFTAGRILGISENDAGEGTDNNCQNLNIWTPGLDDAKRPVMVWLHGGGFSNGSANEEGYVGADLAKNGDVVVVGVNHRLNVFGHMDLAAFGDKYKDSANIGIVDIIDALKWVQDNIEAFGGDPGNVTVFGESGGGAKVLALMTAPEAKGLFGKGIVESGATENMGVTFLPQDLSIELGALVLEKLGISEDNIEDIQTVDAADLQNAGDEAHQELAKKYQLPASIGVGYDMAWEPVVDGNFLPTDPVTEDGFAEAGKDIPLLIGSNLNEWSYFMPEVSHPDMTDEQREMFAEAYPNEDAGQAEYVDTLIRLPMLKIMSHKADQNGAAVYSYVFTKQVSEEGGSYHTAEIPFVFGLADGPLAETMSVAWANFARNGVPSADGLDEWEAYTRESGAAMILDDESMLVHHHDDELQHSLTPDYEW